MLFAGATIFPSAIEASWLKFDSLVDWKKAALILLIAVAVGTGFLSGTRVSRFAITPGFIAKLILFPFLLTVLISNETASVLGAAWLFLSSHALGMTILKYANLIIRAPSEKIHAAGILSTAVGMGIMALLTFFLGLAGFISDEWVMLELLLVTIICFPQIKTTIQQIADLPWSKPVRFSEFEFAGVFLLEYLFLIYFVCALAPEVGPDAVGFRIAAPAIWLRDGVIKALPEMLNSYGVFAGEIIYLLAIPFTGFKAAKVVQFGLSVLLFASSIVQVPGLRHRKAAPLLLFSFWGSTLVWWQMAWGFVDLVQMFFCFACILAVRLWLDEPDSPIWLAAAGIAGATASMVKLNGVVVLIFASIVVTGLALKKKHSVLTLIKNLTYLGLPAIFCQAPWTIRSYLLTKNPIFPVANELFKSPLIHEMPVVHFGVGLSFPEILGVFWGMFFTPLNFAELGTYHPLILALALPGGIGMALTPSRKEWLWAAAGVFSFAAWLVIEQNSRYSLFAVYFLVLALGIGIIRLQDALINRAAKGMFQLFLLTAAVTGFGLQASGESFAPLGLSVSGSAFPTRAVLGEKPDFEYLTSVPTFFCAQWLNQQYGQNARTFQVPKLRDHLYIDSTASSLPHAVLPVTQPLNEILNAEDGAAIYKTLLKEGYTHIMYSTTFTPELTTVPVSDRKGLFSNEFEETYLQLECADRGLYLYRIRSVPAQAVKPTEAQPNLILNPGFESRDEGGLPQGWNLSGEGVLEETGDNTVFRLDKDALLTQDIDVHPNHTYEIAADYRTAAPDHHASIQINWYDSTGELFLFWREAVYPTDSSSSYTFLQTVPPGVESAVVYVSGGGIEVDNISFKEYPVMNQTPLFQN